MSEFTRRELFERFRENAAETASRTIHTLGLLSETKSSSSRRDPSLLVDIEVTDECSACEVCAKVCPEGALKWPSCEEGKRLQFAPHLCIACGICRDSCRQKAITISTTSTFSPDGLIRRENRTVITVSAFNCERCSIRSFSNKGGKMCFVCKAQSTRKRGVKCSA